jgi:hypothetical protein
MWEPNAIEAGLIATGITLLGILITNQAKVSEFRQKWIDALREDAAMLITHTLMIHAASKDDNVDESFVQVQQTTARIRLRLNPKEKKTETAVAAMNQPQRRTSGSTLRQTHQPTGQHHAVYTIPTIQTALLQCC